MTNSKKLYEIFPHAMSSYMMICPAMLYGHTVCPFREEITEENMDKYDLILQALARLKGDIQRRMSKHVILKYTPVLHFLADHNLAEGDRVIQLLRELEENEEDESL